MEDGESEGWGESGGWSLEGGEGWSLKGWKSGGWRVGSLGEESGAGRWGVWCVGDSMEGSVLWWAG